MILLLQACDPKSSDRGDSPGGPADDTGPDDTATGEPPALTWTSCDDGTECATLVVPLEDGADEQISLHLRRLLPPREATRILWYVDGGPGDAGTRLVPVLGFFQDVFDDLAIYAMDQRGTGASAPLACPAEQAASSEEGAVIAEAEWPACITSLDAARLPAFSTVAAADDLALAVAAAAGGLDVVLFGASYGSWLTQRVLERHPDLAVAAVLDGLVPPDWTFAEFDPSMDETGRRYLALCDADEACAARLGGDAAGFAGAVLDARAKAPCGPYDRRAGAAILGALLLQGDHREAIPATLVKLERCAPDDLDALDHLVASFGAESQQSEVLLANIGASELMPPAVDVAAAEAVVDNAVVATGAGAWMARRADQWPRWSPAPAATVTTSIPVLLLHGGLDPTVPLDRLEALLSAYPGGQAVTPPGAGHVTLNFSDCAAQAYVRFLREPGAEVNDCADEAYREDFELTAAEAEAIFGTTQAW